MWKRRCQNSTEKKLKPKVSEQQAEAAIVVVVGKKINVYIKCKARRSRKKNNNKIRV